MSLPPLAYHVLEQLTSDDVVGTAETADHKGEFGRYVNRAPDFARSQNMPDLVLENIGDVVQYEFALEPPAVEEDQEPITHSAYRDFWARQLASEPWDIYSIAEAMAAEFGLNRGWAFKTARQHLNQLILQARMRGYRQDRLAGRRFWWAGPDPEHPACQWLMEQVPDEGLPYHELVELMGEARQRFVEDPPASTHVVHDWCRHEIREVQ